MESTKKFIKKITGCNVVKGFLVPYYMNKKDCDNTFYQHIDRMLQLALKDSNWLSTYNIQIKKPKKYVELVNQLKKEMDDDIRIGLVLTSNILTTIKYNDFIIWEKKDIEYFCKDALINQLEENVLKEEDKDEIGRFINYNLFFHFDNLLIKMIREEDIRDSFRSGNCIKYCTLDNVIKYIEDNNLYT
uniref:Peptidase_M13_N domain-containing protein n=1 Tax=Parastrongyloides trichosuri TaxID=131310 RepID=A0A0N4ZTR2_PARTI